MKADSCPECGAVYVKVLKSRVAPMKGDHGARRFYREIDYQCGECGQRWHVEGTAKEAFVIRRQ